MGVKWQVLDCKLTLSGALFQLEKTNARVTDANNSAFQILGGEPVRRGERLAAFMWVQSMVRDTGERELLRDLDGTIQHLAAAMPQPPGLVRLTGIYHNLLRRWADRKVSSSRGAERRGDPGRHERPLPLWIATPQSGSR